MIQQQTENLFSRAAALTGFSEFAKSLGLKPAELLKSAHLPLDIEARPEDIITYAQWAGVLRAGAEQASDPLFGLRYGLFQGPAIWGPLFYLVCNASTVGDALEELSLYIGVHTGWSKVRLEVQGADATVCYDPADLGDINGFRQNVEQAAGIGIELLRVLIGRGWSPKAIDLQHVAPCETIHYRRLVGLAPHFNSHCNGLRFDAAALHRPLSAASESLHGLLHAHVQNMKRMTPEELPLQVQQVMISLLPSGHATIERVASYLLVSTRTLQRQLADEGTSFQALLDQTRQSLASRYLRTSTISMTQLADILGYADLSAFSRAFQRWFNLSPRAWQKQHRPGVDAVTP